MAHGIRTGDPHGFNKRRSSKFRVGSRVWQTPEEGRKIYRLKCCGNNNKDEDNSPKTFNDKNHQASSQKFRQLNLLYWFLGYPKKRMLTGLSIFWSRPTWVLICAWLPSIKQTYVIYQLGWKLVKYIYFQLPALQGWVYCLAHEALQKGNASKTKHFLD